MAKVQTTDVYTVAQIGSTRELTPEGYLLCKDVPIARTGEMIYGPTQVPVAPGSDGLIHASRDAATLFHADTIASVAGSPLVNDHPGGFLTPKSFKQHVVGFVRSPRQGTADLANCLVADLLICDADAIEAVQSGKREVSLGYQCEYVQLSPGVAVQENIIANHLALVDKGRCGGLCAIGDSNVTTDNNVTTIDAETAGFLGRLKELFSPKPAAAATLDAAAIEGAVSKAMGAALAPLADALKALTPAAPAPAGATTDAAATADAATADAALKATMPAAYADFRARAEMIAPGFSFPSFDAAATGAAMQDALCTCKRRALDTAFKSADSKSAVAAFLPAGASDFNALPVATVDAAFAGASELIKARNNFKTSAAVFGAGETTTTDGKVAHTPRAINKANREFWSERKPA